MFSAYVLKGVHVQYVNETIDTIVMLFSKHYTFFVKCYERQCSASVCTEYIRVVFWTLLVESGLSPVTMEELEF